MANLSSKVQIINLGEASKFALLSGNSVHGTTNIYCNGKIGAHNDIDSVMRSNDSILSNNNGSVPSSYC